MVGERRPSNWSMLCTWCSATYDSANISALSSEPSASTATSRILRCSALHAYHVEIPRAWPSRLKPSGKGHGAPNVVAEIDAQHKHAKGKRMQQAPQALVREETRRPPSAASSSSTRRSNDCTL